MRKEKIYDINPPQKAKDQPIFGKQKSSFLPSLKKRTPILLGLAAISAAVLSYVYIEPEAKIKILPTQESVYFEIQHSLPGEIFKAEREVSGEFPATGVKVKAVKARGTIRVYNTYSVYSQTLVATTRFVSDNGKLFRTPQRVVIPGAHYEEGKMVPGTIDIEVVADRPGEDYNIEPATFSIPGFVGTPRYTAFYAKSFEPMSGGLEAEVSIVKQEDLDKAKELLTSQALNESETALAGIIPEEKYITIKQTIANEVIEFTSLVQDGQEVGQFTARVKSKAQTLTLAREDIENFAKEYVLSQIPQEKKLDGSSLEVEYSVQDVNLDESEIILEARISARTYSAISEDSLKEIIRNRKAEEAARLIREFPGVEDSRLQLWPFWTNKIPDKTDRISIELNI